jgi:hypothetical protein
VPCSSLLAELLVLFCPVFCRRVAAYISAQIFPSVTTDHPNFILKGIYMTPSGGLRAADERLEKNDSDLLDIRHKLDGFAEAVGVTALEQR